MDTTWTWTDVAPARAGGRPLPNYVRFLFITLALGGGVTFGELLRIIS